MAPGDYVACSAIGYAGYIPYNPVSEWQRTNEAEKRANTLLRANLPPSTMLRTEYPAVEVKGQLSGCRYTVHSAGPSGPCQVSLYRDGVRICGFCVYTHECMYRPASDEVLAMALYIQYAEHDFLETAVPHVQPDRIADYKAIARKVGLRRWVELLPF